MAKKYYIRWGDGPDKGRLMHANLDQHSFARKHKNAWSGSRQFAYAYREFIKRMFNCNLVVSKK